MRIHIDTELKTTVLGDADNFRSLDAVVSGAGDIQSLLGDKGRKDADHIWLKADALRGLAGDRSAEWHEKFDQMVAYAKSKGWCDETGEMVRIHIAG